MKKWIKKLKKFAKKIPVPRRVRNSVEVLKQTYRSFMHDRVMKMSAALSYYTIFSLPPMLLMIIAMASIFFGKDAVEGQVFGFANDFVGNKTAADLQKVLANVTLKTNNVFATIVGGATLLIGATGIFGEIQDSINAMWGLKAKPKKALLRVVLNRVASFSMILVLAFILMVSLILSTALEYFMGMISRNFPEFIVQMIMLLDQVVIFLAISTLFMFIFKVLPDAKVRWKDAFRGAMLSALLFMIGKGIISYYLIRGITVTAYGAAASLIVLLMWVYYSSIILYFGAEFTQAYALFKGRRIEPSRYAVYREEEEAGKISESQKLRPAGKQSPDSKETGRDAGT